jgi:enoyl-CoA hydratase/carnithine racemase
VSGFETITTERHGGVGWLIFDRPDAGNALDATMFAELEQAWTELAADPSVRVIVNTGNGRSFQTGVDVVQMSRDRQALKKFSRQTRDAELRFTAWHLGVVKPVIAAVNGVCAGGGLHFVADADIVIAASDAEFVDPHVSVGQATAYEGITLVRKSPAETIMRMALVGRHERLPAERARQLGLLSEVVDPPERLREAAQELGEKIARNSPAAMAATKRALWAALETGLTDACRQGGAHLVSMWDHPDQTEGPAAFAEQQTPEWQEPVP